MEKDTKKTKEYFVKKTERLLTALYMITGFLPEDEPIKAALRGNGIALLAHVYAGPREESVHVDVLKSIVGEMVSLLSIAKMSGLISSMNADLLVTELVAFCGGYEADTHGVSFDRDMLLPSNFFEFAGDVPQKETPKTHTEGAPSVPKMTYEPVKKPFTGAKHVRKEVPKQQFRRDQIVNIIREKGEITIKDIARVITDCSEKTLQRELISLVSDGIVRKRGERRWSTYSLR